MLHSLELPHQQLAVVKHNETLFSTAFIFCLIQSLTKTATSYVCDNLHQGMLVKYLFLTVFVHRTLVEANNEQDSRRKFVV